MRECNRISALVARLDQECSPEEEERLRRHLQECPDCRRQLRRVGRATRGLVALAFEDEEEEHLSDLELASFAAHGLDAPHADAIVRHLSGCPRCRRELTGVCALLDQHDELLQDDGQSCGRCGTFSEQVRRVISGPRRFSRALVSFAMWVLEFACFGLAVFQMLAAYVVDVREIGTPDVLAALGLAPRNEPLIWSALAVLITLGILFRWLGAQFYHSAVAPE
ncbi:MAG: zf-HC2 domain-containing protein [Armatimonadota bacterium]|nr:zf-HC2 domain-containing protein [Armatimonadota bacterium]